MTFFSKKIHYFNKKNLPDENDKNQIISRWGGQACPTGGTGPPGPPTGAAPDWTYDYFLTLAEKVTQF